MALQQPHGNHGLGSTQAKAGCFCSTVVVESNTACYMVRGVLLDTGADHSFVHSRLVKFAELEPKDVEPEGMTIADGRLCTYSKTVDLTIWISGVSNVITAFVDDHEENDLLLQLGTDMFHEFRCKMSGGHRGGQDWRVMVSENTTGLRRLQFVVEPDGGRGTPSMTKMDKTNGIRWSKENAKTPREYDEAQRRKKQFESR